MVRPHLAFQCMTFCVAIDSFALRDSPYYTTVDFNSFTFSVMRCRTVLYYTPYRTRLLLSTRGLSSSISFWTLLYQYLLKLKLPEDTFIDAKQMYLLYSSPRKIKMKVAAQENWK
jgi:hypothetical protein